MPPIDRTKRTAKSAEEAFTDIERLQVHYLMALTERQVTHLCLIERYLRAVAMALYLIALAEMVRLVL